MSPQATRIRRVFLFCMPVLVTLLAIGWFARQDPSFLKSPSLVRVARPEATPLTKAPSLLGERLNVSNLPVAAPLDGQVADQQERPKSPVVADLFSRFQQGDRKVAQSVIKDMIQHPVGKRVGLRIGGLEFNGVVDSRQDNQTVVHMGVTLDDKLGRLVVSLRDDQRILASIMFNGESQAFAIRGFPESGSWKMEATTVSGIACRPAGSTYPFVAAEVGALKAIGKAPLPAVTGPLAAPPLLNSNPSSTFVLYIDFDGESVTSPAWNNGQTIVAAPDPRANDATYVTNVWKRTSEDFSSFDINVTTDRAVFDAAAVSRRVMNISTPTDTAAQGAGGVAILTSFGQDIPCWNYNIADEYGSAATVSHEVGHTLGLLHQGATVNGTHVEYYGGNGGTGPTSWAPIMGAPWANADDESVVQWAKGEYPNANNQEDALNIITTQNGFTYRVDDKGSSQASASSLAVSQGVVSDSGIIERNTGEDWFSFVTSGGNVNLNVAGIDVNSAEDPQAGTTLAASAELYDAAGKQLAVSNPPGSMSATIQQSVAAGTFYLKVSGAGRGDLTTGFSKYASLGQYTITGSVPQAGLLTVTPASINFNAFGGTSQFRVSSTQPWTWVTDASWVTSAEPVSQNGDQLFDFKVDRNPSQSVRTAAITLSTSGYTVKFTITQDAAGADDHGNDITTATLIDQVSTTDGKLETPGDIDVFRINVKGFGDLTVKAAGTTDTFGEILDYSGKVIASNDNGYNPGFRILLPVSVGTYYVRVRHARPYGVGAYQVISSFTPTDVISVSVESKTFGADGGKGSFDVISNSSANWTWTSDAAWLTSTEPASQLKGQKFDYTVLPNATLKARTAHITVTTGTGSAVHTVFQNGAHSDDHGNTTATATVFAPDGAINGRIDYEGDVDVFSITLNRSGVLTVNTTGTLDTRGELLGPFGKVLASNDDFDGSNFQISKSLDAGTYFVKVSHFNNTGLGDYRLVSDFVASGLINLRYKAADGGTLVGKPHQVVSAGGDGTGVKAVPNFGFGFLEWSDGGKSPFRKDRAVVSDISVVCRFIRSMSVGIAGGPLLSDSDTLPVDYGTVPFNQSKQMTFEIGNHSTVPLTGLKIVESGANRVVWSSSALPSTTIAPGKSLRFTVAIKSPTTGYKSATYTISANESGFVPFSLRVMAYVDRSIASLANGPSAGGSSAIASSSSVAAGTSGGTVGETSGNAVSASAAPDSWVAISQDGLFHYRFNRPHGDRSPVAFWVSGTGNDWVEARVLSVIPVSKGNSSDEFEAALAPLNDKDLVILVSETPHPLEKP